MKKEYEVKKMFPSILVQAKQRSTNVPITFLKRYMKVQLQRQGRDRMHKHKQYADPELKQMLLNKFDNIIQTIF